MGTCVILWVWAVNMFVHKVAILEFFVPTRWICACSGSMFHKEMSLWYEWLCHKSQHAEIHCFRHWSSPALLRLQLDVYIYYKLYLIIMHTFGPQNLEKWRFWVLRIRVITPKNEGGRFPWYGVVPGMISSDRHGYSYRKELKIIAFPLRWFSSNPDAVAQVNGAGGAYRVIPTPGNLIGGLMGRGGGGTRGRGFRGDEDCWVWILQTPES